MDISDLELFYRANFSNLVKKIYRSCGNMYDAEDIVQEAFERATKYIVTCKDMDKWFSIILRNTYRDYISRSKAWPVTKPLDEHLSELEPSTMDTITPNVMGMVYKLVEEQEEPNKTILQLHFQFGMTEGEINQLVRSVTIRKVSNTILNFRRKIIENMK